MINELFTLNSNIIFSTFHIKFLNKIFAFVRGFLSLIQITVFIKF